MSTHILGIRHHGPGSSANLLEALAGIRPDIILIEGPPEGEGLLTWASHTEMKPPVAMLAYVPENPQRSVFYPFAEYSPEWNAIQYGNQHQIPIRLIDMPLVHQLAEAKPTGEENEQAPETEHMEAPIQVRKNPIAYLAEIAGFEDAEEWWEQEFELKKHPTEVFEAIAIAMTHLRETYPSADPMENIREAFMRKAIRQAQREMYNDIVVVCGAWHVPGLQNMPAQKADDQLIKNLPKTKIETTWIPWTNSRMSFESGYGAGVDSPGWYEHVWKKNDRLGVEWMALTARVFRHHRMDVSSAHIIEAVRLSEALASLRELSRPGLKEHIESTQTVMCMGDAVLMNLVKNDLIIGNNMGVVPEGIPKAPIQADFEKQLKSLRLKLADVDKQILLDLRQPDHLEKSKLFHRLAILQIPWAHMMDSRGKGTFKETWTLSWNPEMMISLLEKAIWGNTIEMAANKFLESMVTASNQLAEVIELVQMAIPAELHEGISISMKKMDELAATTSDTHLLMDAFIPLVQISRYGNVRKTDATMIATILDSTFYRLAANLSTSVSQMDEARAAEMAEKIKKVHASVQVLDEANYKNDWLDTLATLIEIKQTEPVIHGTCCKILYDAGILTEEQTRLAFDRALSVNNEPSYSANWIEGFLKDGAITLLMDDIIWDIVNNWVKNIEEDMFIQILPLLRRTFALYTAAEKQKIAAQVTSKKTGRTFTATGADFNTTRAEKVLPVFEKLLRFN
jgi:hypothetical protein